ncbi:trafficking protein particle complex subunit 8 homolog l(3)76BDm isoform X2 [Lycorma delicatula]|uniref:trafficking protein particle complex subunit 8 homolog l(3)76BDm isoform X2 n=1 Tax=Lycorma delicatula TaxID=130591 RepID=UPI003F511AAB
MANLKLTSQEFIQNSFCPLIASMCSPLVDQVCQKNNLTFSELIQPFCKLSTEAYIKDPSGTSIPVKNLRIRVKDVHSQPPQPTVARKLLNEAASSGNNDRTTSLEICGILIDIPCSFPWFESWRETFLQVQFPSDHEFIKHYLGCILVVSSKESNPTECLSRMGEELGKMQIEVPNALPKWFSSTNILRYYVLLHDNIDTDIKMAEKVFEGMKTAYGNNSCFLLCINSQTAVNADSQLADPWNQYLMHHYERQDTIDVDLTPVENHMIEAMTASSGTFNIEPAQEVGESSPVILHPLSPINETQHIIANNNCAEKYFGLVCDGAAVWEGVGIDLAPKSGPLQRQGLITGISNMWPRSVQHGACMTSEDMDRIRKFVTEFCMNALLPYVENYIHQLNDIISNKKGVSRSLLSATKRWFGSNKPGLPGNSLPPTAVTYSNDSPEIQLRRLGDLYFMFHAYNLAYSAYHSAKRDFNADSAWLYYAGALEMAALSLFLQGGDTARKAHDYADESILIYLNPCRMPQFATRATLFSTECLKGRGMYGEAAKQLIRMTSEESDLRSALLLEQAAYCFLTSSKPPMPRKYAFHLVLAGHRFSKANQKKHSLRCYRQAYQVYEGKNWSLAEDHIHHTIGRMASGLKQGQEAAEAFARLLPRASRQAPTQQATFLREYLTTQQELSLETGEVPVLPLPVVDGSTVQVLLGSAPQLSSFPPGVIPASGISFDQNQQDNARWSKLEEKVVGFALEGHPMIFKPTIELLNNTTNNSNSPMTYVNEVVSVSVNMGNPLHIPLNLQNVRLLWSFIPADGGLCQDNQPELTVSPNPAAVSQILNNLIIESDSTKKVVLKVTPRQVGELRITGLGYSLHGDGVNTVEGRQHLVVPPRPSSRAPKDHRPPDASIDNRLKLTVIDSTPCLRVTFKGLRSELVCGELQSVQVELHNCGSTPVSRIMVVSSTPHLFSIGDKRPSGICIIPLSTPLEPQQTAAVQMSLRAPDLKGSSFLHLLFYYQGNYEYKRQEKNRPRYRLVRHSWPISVYESLQVSAIAIRSCSSCHKKETLNLRLRVKNNNQIHDPLLTEISIQLISLYSQSWQLSQQAYSPKELQLEAQEVVHLVLQATRRNSTKDQELSSVHLLKEPSDLKPSKDFLISSSSNVESQDELNNIALKELESAITLNSTLILMWKGEVTENGGCKRIAEGQHHVQLARLDEQTTWPPDPLVPSFVPPTNTLRIFGSDSVTSHLANNSAVIRQWLLTFSLIHPRTVHHDFSINRVCIVSIKVAVQNCCESTVNIKIEARGPTTSSHRSQLYSPRSAISFHWVGRTVSIETLKPNSRSEVLLSIAIAAPGSYDIGSHLTVSARQPQESNSDYVPQVWRPETTLIVT